MIEYVDLETLQPIEFFYTAVERNTACFAAELHQTAIKRVADEHLATPDTSIQAKLLLVRAGLLESELLVPPQHIFVASVLLPHIIRIDSMFRTAEVLAPDVSYGEACDQYGVRAEDLSHHASHAREMRSQTPEIRYIG